MFPKKKYEVTIYTLPHLKCIRLVSAGSISPCVRIKLTLKIYLKRVACPGACDEID